MTDGLSKNVLPRWTHSIIDTTLTSNATRLLSIFHSHATMVCRDESMHERGRQSPSIQRPSEKSRINASAACSVQPLCTWGWGLGPTPKYFCNHAPTRLAPPNPGWGVWGRARFCGVERFGGLQPARVGPTKLGYLAWLVASSSGWPCSDWSTRAGPDHFTGSGVGVRLDRPIWAGFPLPGLDPPNPDWTRPQPGRPYGGPGPLPELRFARNAACAPCHQQNTESVLIVFRMKWFYQPATVWQLARNLSNP